MVTFDSDRSVNMAGKIDLLFGVNGVVSLNVPGAQISNVKNVVTRTEDILYVCGTAQINLVSKFFITALDSTGNVIPGFGDSGYVIDRFAEEAEAAYGSELILSGDKLLLVGHSYIGTSPFPALARFDLNGNIDTTFGENGRGKIVHQLPGPPDEVSGKNPPDTVEPGSTNNSPGRACSANILSDGKILLSHFFFRIGAPAYGVIVRTLANGSLDTDFAEEGLLPVIAPGYENAQTQTRSVTVDSEGRYVVCGSVNGLGSAPASSFFARYSDEGVLDSTFGPKGFRILPSPNGFPGGSRAMAMIPLEKDKLFCFGRSVNDPYVSQLLMLTERGEFDPDFNQGEPLNTQLAESSTLWESFTRQSNGNFVVVGGIDKKKESFVFDIVVACFDRTGKPDPHFNDGLGWARTRLSKLTDGALAVIIQRGKIIVAGASQGKGVVLRYHG